MQQPNCRSKQVDLETVRRTQEQYDALSIDGQLSEKLQRLRAFVEQLSETPSGKADLVRRTLAFGPCQPVAGENDRQFYGRLRHWLDATVNDNGDGSEQNRGSAGARGADAPRSR